MSSDKVEITEDMRSITQLGEIKMEKYNSKKTYHHDPDDYFFDDDAPENVDRLDYPHIVFGKEDGKCGMKVSLEEIVDVWLERLEPEQQQKLELEETTRREKRELATLRKEKERREEDEKRSQVGRMLKPFLSQQILKVLKERGLEITKSNIRSLIRECKEYSWYHSDTKYQYKPKGILFTEKDWDAFREQCNKIWKNGFDNTDINRVPKGYYDNYMDAVRYGITTNLTELRDAPISDWK